MSEKPYDPTLKDLVETEPESWPAFLGHPKGPTKAIDADVATVSGAADKALRVDADPPYLLHLEFVAGHDAAVLPRKLHVRNGLLDDRHDLPVRTCVVVLRPEANSPQLTGVYRREFPGEEEHLIFRYRVLRVWELESDLLLKSGLSLLPLALIGAVTRSELPGIIQRIGQRLSGRRARKQAAKVWGAAYILLGLRFSSALAEELFRGVEAMKESSTYQAILAEGRKEGKAEGRAEGRVVQARRFLRVLGDKAFGPPDARIADAIDHLDDLDRLEEMFQRVQTAASWQELLHPPTAGRRGGRRRS